MRRQRPSVARSAGDGMKLHRRVLRLDGRDHTVIGLRPGTRVRFSTNRFHDTWHVLSDGHGARVLARLLWGLSYQARPGTLLVIDREFVGPTPFDADPGDPIVLVPAWCTPFTGRVAGALKARLPLRSAPDGTVRWRTHGLEAAMATSREDWWRPERGVVERSHGLIVLRPHSAADMRDWAVQAARLNANNRYGTDHEYLGPGSCWADGEIQIFRDFHRDVSVARRARADVLARPGVPDDELLPLIWAQHSAIGRGRSRRVGNCRGIGPREADLLASVGVHTLDDLAKAGPVAVYRWLGGPRQTGPELLWALEKALTGRDVPDSRKAELLTEAGR
ncbi:TfoX/Sxy family DNA transformation protein [Actinomadura hibisca]|uniref:TfoX/Sxy family DNA transformation protein n=1 Tax=Actinomadura hibisca TaxID=68565 RepID=UPI000A6483D1|nr:TfoX/Sxy family DNA transformation protein [Actinomadura hibisca]